ncbi:hypothetical protein ACQYZM_29380, partial [Pseudomonas aeruginosa]|uniref:hypothetical protein n=1 Tax=Pseudomonas aeruginosa TaxID=287 RepID=UPI003D2AAD33
KKALAIIAKCLILLVNLVEPGGFEPASSPPFDAASRLEAVIRLSLQLRPVIVYGEISIDPKDVKYPTVAIPDHWGFANCTE